MSEIVLITGGSRGIGAQTARLAVQQGYSVCFSYRNQQQQADALKEELVAVGVEVIAVQADMGSEADILRLFAAIDQMSGQLKVLVNNAGILYSQASLMELTAERIQHVMAVNVTGSFLCAREAVKRMAISQGGQGGAIVNLSSGAARLGAPNEYVDYAASKGAIDTMTIGLAKEVAADGVRVNAVRPGLIYTDIHADGGEPGRVDRLKHAVPMQRGGEALEVAKAIMWLASDDASYTTGSFIDVTGGR